MSKINSLQQQIMEQSFKHFAKLMQEISLSSDKQNALSQNSNSFSHAYKFYEFNHKDIVEIYKEINE